MPRGNTRRCGNSVSGSDTVPVREEGYTRKEGFRTAGDPAFFRATGNALVSDDLNMAFYYKQQLSTGAYKEPI